MFSLIPRKSIFVNPFKLMEESSSSLMKDFFSDFPFKPMSEGSPSFNIYQDKDQMVVEASVPGYNKENITVELKDDMLTIRGEMKENTEKKEKEYVYREFHSGSFSRSIRLQEKVKPEDLKARYKDGILEIRLPSAKKEEEKEKTNIINIE